MGSVARSALADAPPLMVDADANLRPTEADDVPAMASIEALAFSDPWPAKSFVELLAHPYARVMTAIDAKGGILGYCVLLQAADEAEIANIAVAPGARRRGIGAKLLDDAISAAAGAGVRALFLEVRESNTAARALYASREFSAVGRRRGYYRCPVEDALVLRRTSMALE